MRRFGSRLANSLILILLLSLHSPVYGQSIWLPPHSGSRIDLEILKADYTFGGVSASSRVYYIGGQAAVSRRVSLVLELPISHYDEELVEVAFSFPPQWISFDPETKVGNPYVGLVSIPKRSPFVVEGGIRLPMTNDEDLSAAINGWYTDFDRWDAFLTDIIALRLRAGQDASRSSESTDYYSRWRLGTTLWIPTESYVDGEWFIDAAASFWIGPGAFLFGATLAGRTLLSGEGLSFGERSEFSVGFGACAQMGPIRPGLHVHLPVSNNGLIGAGDVVDVVYGISLSYLFPQKSVTHEQGGRPPGF